MSDPSPTRVAAAVSRACRELRLDPALEASVRAYLDEGECGWPTCCGGDCDPCVRTLGEAARRAGALLERG